MFLFQIMNLVFFKSEAIFIQIIWGITTICGIATTGKVADDWQRGLNYNKELAEG